MDTRFKEGQRVTLFGLIANTLLAVGKGAIGIIAFSEALIADAIESVSDIIATLFVLISLRIAGKPKDPEHPYGHYKAEQVASAFVGLVITLAGLAIVIAATFTIITGPKRPPGAIALYVAIAVIIIKEGLYQYTSRIGKKINSMAVMANAWDHRKDAFTTIATLVGIAGARLGYLILDPIAAIVVALLIFRIGYVISYQAINELIDIAPPKKILNEIVNIALSVNGIEHVTDVRARKTGPYLIVDLKLEIDSQMSVADSHHNAGLVKREIMRQMPDVSDVMIHVNPHIAHN